MSLYEMHYVNSASEQIRLKEQQKKMLKALQELSISTKIQAQQQRHRLDSWYRGARDIAPECRPYSPYNVSYVSSSTSSISSRQRTPSMSSANSSFVSENASEKDRIVYEMTERDRYGLKRPIQWVNPKQLHDFEVKYEPMLQRQSKHWNKLFANNNQQWPALCPELTRYVRKGIPQDIRTKAWMHYSGADNRMKKNSGVYISLIKQECQYAPTIERDLHCSFPDNSFFAPEVSETKLLMLQRILCAFSLYVPDIGYRQPLIFVAGFLVLICKEEEEAFWLLVTAIQDYFPKTLFDEPSSEQTILMMMVYEKMPSIWSKIGNRKCFWECEQTETMPPITLVTSHWFSTMFVNVLPVETVLRIWDCFFVGEGFKVLYQVALTIMKLDEQAICSVADSVDIIQILQKSPKRLIDCHEFIKSVFSPHDIIHDITLQEIDRKRDLFRNRKN